MATTFQITEQDYVKAVKLSARYATRIFTVIAFIIALFFLFLFGKEHYQTAVIVGVGLMLWGVFCFHILNLILWKRHYREHKVIHQTFSIELINDNQLDISSGESTTNLNFEKMLKWRENNEFILIYLMPRLFFIVPKRIGEQGFDIDRLAVLLKQHLGKDK